jgi:tetrahydromethanopterin S-methyltransferase subunit C
VDTDGTTKSSPEGLGTIVSGIVEDLQEIVRGEVKLAKAEIKDDVSAMGKGAASIAAAAIFALVGFIFLMLGVTYLLNKWLEMWIAAGIVGVALLLIGAMLAMSGKKKLSASSLKPTESMESLKEDQAWASQQIKSVKK